MGWSCTMEQSKALEKLQVWERKQEGFGTKPETLFLEFNPFGMDYGPAPMIVDVLKLTGEGWCIRVGKIKIFADGSYENLPAKIKLEEAY